MTGPESDMQNEAHRYAKSYSGPMSFMRKMSAEARRDPRWVPTQKQAIAILKCRAYDTPSDAPRTKRYYRKK